MDDFKVKKLDIDKYLTPTKLALEFLPAHERPDFEEYVQLVKTSSKNIPSVRQIYKGHNFAGMFLAESGEKQFENWNPSNGDVLISAYPKTGTTWITEIMRHILYKGNDKQMKLASVLTQPFTYLELFNPSLHEAYKKFPLERRFYSTHMTSDCVNVERVLKSGCKIICVLRNPKDQLVSWYNFAPTLPYHDEGYMAEVHPKEWDKFFEKYITGQQPTFCKDGEWYPHHILSWYPYRNHKNVKFVYYEDLKKDPVSIIKDLAGFVRSERTNKEILEIAENTTLKKMKSNKVAPEPFLRKGIVGDWKNKFTVAQSEMMDEKMNKILSGTDIKFTYE